MTWRFRRGWPCKLSGPTFNATSNEVAIETLEIAHEGIEKG
jgi:phage tail-like protein